MDLGKVRQSINAIDDELVPLLCKRMECAKTVADVKKKDGTPVLNREREEQILSKVGEKAGEYGAHIRNIYSSIIGESRARQYHLQENLETLRSKISAAPDSLPLDWKLGVCTPDKGYPVEYKHYKTPETLFMAIQKGQIDAGIIHTGNMNLLQMTILLSEYQLHLAGFDQDSSLATVTSDFYVPKDAKTISLLMKLSGEPNDLSWIMSRLAYAGCKILSINTLTLAGDIIAEFDFSGNLRNPDVLDALCAIIPENDNVYLVGNY